MNRIIEPKTEELIINKSRFISCLYFIDDEIVVNEILNKIKNTYKNATHYCYAYIINDIKRYRDDGEPTAGIPILKTLEQNNLDNVLCVVVRYFGGVKLGVGGLTRAYVRSCQLVVKDNVKPYKKEMTVRIDFEYNNVDKINFLLKEAQVLEKKFAKDIQYTFTIDENTYLNISDELKLLTKKTILK